MLAGVVMAAAAAAVLSLASYFLAGEHTAVFDRISSPIMSRILDVAVMVTLFSTGFVMFAGAGANLRQQFDLPLWVGSLPMAIVIGGTHLNPREAGVGGLLGGAIFGGLLIIVSVALFYSVEAVGGDDMPMLTIVDRVNPALGVAMAVVVYGMIFNTAIGMFYALGKRLTRNRKDRFRPVFLGSVAVGLALSFIGFQTLVSTVYPAIGYIGIVLIIVVIVARMTGRAKLAEEAERRAVIRDLVRRRLDPRAVFSRDDSARLEREVAASNADDRELIDTVRSEVSTELDDGPATPQSAETTKESDR